MNSCIFEKAQLLSEEGIEIGVDSDMKPFTYDFVKHAALTLTSWLPQSVGSSLRCTIDVSNRMGCIWLTSTLSTKSFGCCERLFIEFQMRSLLCKQVTVREPLRPCDCSCYCVVESWWVTTMVGWSTPTKYYIRNAQNWCEIKIHELVSAKLFDAPSIQCFK